MRYAGTALGFLLALSACGENKSEPPTKVVAPAASLQGAGWIGDAVDPTKPSDKVHVLAFFKPT